MYQDRYPTSDLSAFPTDYFLWQQEQPISKVIDGLLQGDPLSYILMVVATTIVGAVLLQLGSRNTAKPRVSQIGDHDQEFIAHLKKLSEESRKDAGRNFRRGVLLCLLSLVILYVDTLSDSTETLNLHEHKLSISIAIVLQALAGVLAFQGRQYAVLRQFAETYIIAIYEGHASRAVTAADGSPDARLVLLSEMSKKFADMRLTIRS